MIWTSALRFIGACLAAAVAATCVVGPANAERVAHRDAVNDVQRFVSDPNHPHQAPDAEPAPRHRNGDLKHYSIAYRHSQIRVRLAFRELDHSEPRLLVGASFRYHAHGQLWYTDVAIRAGRHHWKGRTEISDGSKCRIRHHLDYAHNRAAISFPAKCLGSPRWVQFTTGAVTTDNLRHPSYFYGDRQAGTLPREVWTTRIHRG